MAKKSSVERNLEVGRRIVRNQPRRARLKKKTMDRTLPLRERLRAVRRLAELPRSGSRTRYRNRCHATGRPRGFYRKFKLSRIAFRELASSGQVPGVTKASW